MLGYRQSTSVSSSPSRAYMAIPVSFSLSPNPTFTSRKSPPSASSNTSEILQRPSLRIKPNLISLPLNILRRILSHLLVSPNPVILHRDAAVPPAYRTNITASVLLVNRRLYHTSLPILYGGNTFTTSTPSTSHDFDVHLSTVPGRMRLLMRKVELEIDWAAELWKKFPLIAVRLQELKGLRSLKLYLMEKEDDNKDPGVVIQGVKGRKEEMRQREGHVGEVLLKAEKKMLEDLVKGLKGLRVFGIKGFEDRGFARELERWVKRGRRC
ncbi:MAG: hypothetical protein Q9186_002233 [Xanthomendoza sp. 1 TL-2023]